jgi:hypothetical protein
MKSRYEEKKLLKILAAKPIAKKIARAKWMQSGINPVNGLHIDMRFL